MKGASKYTVAETLVTSGSIVEGQNVLVGGLISAEHAESALSQAKSQVMSHRGQGFKTSGRGRTQKDEPGKQPDVKLLEQALAITQGWAKQAAQENEGWEVSLATAEGAVGKVTSGPY